MKYEICMSGKEYVGADMKTDWAPADCKSWWHPHSDSWQALSS